MAQLDILRKSEHENIIKYIEWFTEDHKYGKHYFLVTAYYKVYSFCFDAKRDCGIFILEIVFIQTK